MSSKSSKKSARKKWDKKYQNTHREELKEKARLYRYRNKNSDRSMKSLLCTSRKYAKKYGYISCNASIDELLKSYTGFCLSCGISESELSERLCMDHNHKTGDFRGWLCRSCNLALGLLKESPDRMSCLIEYIKRVSFLPF